MSLSANQIRAIEAENLINYGINIVEEILNQSDGYDNSMSWKQRDTLTKWVINAKSWRDGE